ncbi:MAG: Hsp70 family protein [Planctomycetales bacterium]|nr:Hsp70 family protein [Planctomycetales bacterium]
MNRIQTTLMPSNPRNQAMSDEKYIFGIDLGTTYSCIAYVNEHGQPSVEPNSDNELTTPSVVYFEDETNVVVGKSAKDAIRTDSHRVASKFKREMGNTDWRFEVDGKAYRAQQLSALVLERVVEDAEKITGKTIKDVVITCPAYFGLAQKKATQDAGELAGLNVRYVIPEPTAAAIAYGADQKGEDVVLVYDLGGGTFDITLIEIAAKSLKVLTTDGNAELGGFNWDSALADFFVEKVAEETGADAADIRNDAEFYADLLLISEEAKKTLTNKQTAKQVFLYDGERVRAEVTRDEFNRITKTLLDETIDTTRSVINRAKEKSGMRTPNTILLVGGSTFMPQVEERIAAEFPELEIKRNDPNQIVAKGAALFGLKTSLEDRAIEIYNETSDKAATTLDEVDEEKKIEILTKAGEQYGLPAAKANDLGGKSVQNVTSRSFGMKAFIQDLNAMRIANLIHVDDAVPADVTQRFETMENNQRTVDIEIFENEMRTDKVNSVCEESSSVPLAQAVLDLGGPFPKGSPIDVTFKLSPDGLLDVVAQHSETGNKVDVQLRIEGAMTDEEFAEAKSTAAALTRSE